MTAVTVEISRWSVARLRCPAWLRTLMRNRKARVGLVLLSAIVVAVASAPLLTHHGPEVALEHSAQAPSWRYPFGTTNEGFDVLSQVLYGGRVTLLVTGAATVLGMVLAVATGVAAGTLGGRVDAALSTFVNAFLLVPVVPLAIVVASVLPQNNWVATAAMVGAACWAGEARILRAQALSLRSQDFLRAAAGVGESRWRIAFVELLPNMAGRVAAGFCFVAIQSVILLSTLYFLGFGNVVDMSWGRMLEEAQLDQSILAGSWWHFFFPSLALVLTATSLVLLLNGLEELVDPRLRVAHGLPRGRLRLRPPRLGWPGIRLDLPGRPRLGLPTGSALTGAARHLAHRAWLYLAGLWCAATLCYLLPVLLPRADGWQGATGPVDLSGYGRFLADLVTGHIDQHAPGVAGVLRSAVPFSLLLVGGGTLVAFLVGTALGLAAAWRRGGVFESVTTTSTAILWATPMVVLGLLALAFLAIQFGLFPVALSYDADAVPGWNVHFVVSVLRHAELPMLVVAISTVGFWVLNVRTTATTALNEDYVLLARAIGIRGRRIAVRYVGRNAMLPVLTGFGVAFGAALGGVVAIEQIFSYQGAGWEFDYATSGGDLPLLQALFLAFAVAVVLVNLTVDVLQVALDPRLRAGRVR